MDRCSPSTASSFGTEETPVFIGTEPSKPKVDPHLRTALELLELVLRYKRPSKAHGACDESCPSCQSPHLPKVLRAVRANEPVVFVLPAFPGKSPNLAKVLGALPDMAEKLALQFLDELCEDIRELHAPGARMVLCSDGRVFSDVVGMLESDVTDYQDELESMITELGLTNVSTFNLDTMAEGKGFVQLREELMAEYGSPLELLREKVLRGSKQPNFPEDEEAHRMYCGITRFLVEDSTFPGQTKSRTAVQKECRARAYEVIRRSNAWSERIAARFPEAVRLSIHPQACGSKKLGIRLIGTESWMTPWHGVAVKRDGEFVLMKRWEAESLGAKLVHSAGGRASHFELSALNPSEQGSSRELQAL